MKKFAILLSMLMLLVGCSLLNSEESDEPVPGLEENLSFTLESKSDIMFYADETSNEQSEINFTISSDWSAEVVYHIHKSENDDAKWIHLSQTEGVAGENSIFVELDNNFTGYHRSAEILINVDHQPIAAIRIVQTECNEDGEVNINDLGIKYTTIYVSGKGETFVIALNGKMVKDCEVGDDIEVVSVEDSEYSFKMGENPSDEPRERTITFISKDDRATVVDVIQQSKEYEELLLEKKSFDLLFEDDEVVINIISGSNINCIENVSWLYVKEKSDDKAVLGITEKDFEDLFTSRSAEVVITADGGKTQLVVITQTGILFGGDDFIEIPDANLKSALLVVFDMNRDGEITEQEAAQNRLSSTAGLLRIGSKNIFNLEGLQYFTSVTGIDFSNNRVTSFDFGQMPWLKMLFCDSNPITSLDLTKNTNIELLYAKQTISLKSVIGLKDKVKLEEVNFYNSGINEIDLSGCSALYLVNFTGCGSLSKIIGNNCGVSYVDLSNLSSLSEVVFSNSTKVKTATIYGCSRLTKLYLNGCSLLESVVANGGNLNDIYFTNCPSLASIDLKMNNLENQDIADDLSKVSSLQFLDLSDNNLSSLNLDGCTNLMALNVAENNFTSFDALGLKSYMTKMDGLVIGDNNINGEIPSWYKCMTNISSSDGISDRRRYNYEYFKINSKEMYRVVYSDKGYGIYYPGEPRSGIHDWKNPLASQIVEVVPR